MIKVTFDENSLTVHGHAKTELCMIFSVLMEELGDHLKGASTIIEEGFTCVYKKNMSKRERAIFEFVVNIMMDLAHTKPEQIRITSKQ